MKKYILCQYGELKIMEDNKNFQVDKIISCTIKDAKTGDTLSEWQFERCPLFDFIKKF